MKKGILSALVLTMALAPTAVGVNAHYDSTAKNSTIKTVLKEQKLTVEEAKKQMEDAKAALDAKRTESEKASADKLAKFNEMQNAEIAASKANDAKDKATNDVREMEAKLSQAVKDLASVEQQKQDLIDTNVQLNKDIEAHKEVIETAKAELAKAQAELPDVKTKYESAKNSLDTTYNNINDLKKQLEEAKENNNLAAIDAINKRIEALKVDLEYFDSIYQPLSFKLTELENSIKDNTGAIEYSNNQIVSLKEQIKTNEDTIVQLDDSINKLHADMQTYGEAIPQLKNVLQNAEIAASKANDAKVAAQEAYDLALKAEKDALDALPALEEAYNNAKAAYDKLVAEQDKPVKPEAKPENKPAKKPVSTWDDGGPFTTNAEGDVFDRWGNLIYDAPAKAHSSNGYTMVNTSDR